MTPREVAASYDELAPQWAAEAFPQANGIAAHERAIAFVPEKAAALDVGCGASGRIVALLLAQGFAVEGLDLSPRMLDLARARHPQVTFHHADIGEWNLPRQYAFISAWDSIWHLPLASQEPVLRKLFAGLASGGVCIFTTGGLDAPEEKSDASMGQPMYYSVLGLPRLLRLVDDCGCVCRHLEYDQFPELHVYLIVQRLPATFPRG